MCLPCFVVGSLQTEMKPALMTLRKSSEREDQRYVRDERTTNHTKNTKRGLKRFPETTGSTSIAWASCVDVEPFMVGVPTGSFRS